MNLVILLYFGTILCVCVIFQSFHILATDGFLFALVFAKPVVEKSLAIACPLDTCVNSH